MSAAPPTTRGRPAPADRSFSIETTSARPCGQARQGRSRRGIVTACVAADRLRAPLARGGGAAGAPPPPVPADVEQPPLLLQRLRRHRVTDRQHALDQADEKDRVPLEALRGI